MPFTSRRLDVKGVDTFLYHWPMFDTSDVFDRTVRFLVPNPGAPS